jgi:predicted deacylase
MITFSFGSQSYQTERIIGKLIGDPDGPVLVFIGGIHGNEPSGVVALQKVITDLSSRDVPVRGTILGIAGNLVALKESKRFISRDLNRVWGYEFEKRHRLNGSHPTNGSIPEFAEQSELFEIIAPLLGVDRPIYFFDLHTTSAPSVPFIAINDQLDNRNFALQFPLPTVLGIEEYLEGPLLSYINDYGHVAMAFEAGQHDDPESVSIHASFAYLAMIQAGAISAADVKDLPQHQHRLENLGRDYKGFYEVIFRKPISSGDGFVMNPGYNNFTTIRANEELAADSRGRIRAPWSGRIFMPLYQDSGNDGFFVIRDVPLWALKLSSVLRRFNFEKLLVVLPGVSRSPDQKDALVVNKKIARLLANQLFHLLGYRRKRDDGTTMVFSRREIRD